MGNRPWDRLAAGPMVCVCFLPFYLLNDLEYVLYLNLKVYPGVVHWARVRMYNCFSSLCVINGRGEQRLRNTLI